MFQNIYNSQSITRSSFYYLIWSYAILMVRFLIMYYKVLGSSHDAYVFMTLSPLRERWVFDKSLTIRNIIEGFPSAITRRIAYPINQIIELISHNLWIENSNYLVFKAINKFDKGRRWHDTIRNGRGATRFQKRSMKDWVKLHVCWKIKTKGGIVNTQWWEKDLSVDNRASHMTG